MRQDTTALIDRSYQEIVDDLLMAVVGGVVNERLQFDVQSDLYALSEPARAIRSITGTADQNAQHQFLRTVDYDFSADDNAVLWLPGGRWPDDDTAFYVDYFPQVNRSPLTDIHVGSVVRTLTEAYGREAAILYQQIKEAYFAAFLETAHGVSLDYVVAILGLTRKRAEHGVGIVTFHRESAVQGSITLLAGIELTTTDNRLRFETTEQRVLQHGQARVDVPVRLMTNLPNGDNPEATAGEITRLIQPIAGIRSINNAEPTRAAATAESDDALRLRARTALRALSTGTPAALLRAALEANATPLELWDPNSLPMNRTLPGQAVMLVDTSSGRFAALRSRVEEVRAAGVQVVLTAPFVYLRVQVVAHIYTGMSDSAKTELRDEITTRLHDYIDSLNSGDPAEGAVLLEHARAVTGVRPKSFIGDVQVWIAEFHEAPSLVDALVHAAEAEHSDLREAIEQILANAPSQVPSGRRLPGPDLIQGPDGKRATIPEINAGQFRVIARLGEQSGRFVLEPHILFTEAESART
ncbi:MAG: hypothetical protein OHK0046_41950 [Anaerolineae bacterium]